MLDLAGRPLLERLLERVLRCTSVSAVVVATTENAADDVLADLAAGCGASVFRGAEDDVLDRYYQAGRAFDADPVLRLPADNPVAEPAEIDRIVEYHVGTENAFSSNLASVLGNGYPDGIGAEAIAARALEAAWSSAKDPRLREHPHLNFFDYAEQRVVDPRLPVGTIECPQAFRRPELVLDVNTSSEYEFMRELYEYLYPRNPRFHVTDVIRWYDEVYVK